MKAEDLLILHPSSFILHPSGLSVSSVVNSRLPRCSPYGIEPSSQGEPNTGMIPYPSRELQALFRSRTATSHHRDTESTENDRRTAKDFAAAKRQALSSCGSLYPLCLCGESRVVVVHVTGPMLLCPSRASGSFSTSNDEVARYVARACLWAARSRRRERILSISR